MDNDATTAEQPIKRCADCGTEMSPDIKHIECRHCRKCIRPATCGYDHDQWPKSR